MKKWKLIVLSILLYIGVMTFFYIIIAFLKLEIDYRVWDLADRAGWVIVGGILSIIPISAIWMFKDD